MSLGFMLKKEESSRTICTDSIFIYTQLCVCVCVCKAYGWCIRLYSHRKYSGKTYTQLFSVILFSGGERGKDESKYE